MDLQMVCRLAMPTVGFKSMIRVYVLAMDHTQQQVH